MISPLIDLRALSDEYKALEIMKLSRRDSSVLYFDVGLHPEWRYDWSSPLQRAWDHLQVSGPSRVLGG